MRTMRCEICQGRCRYDFSKRFDTLGLTEVEYWRCEGCGFVLSRTHAEMPPQDWEALNERCHAFYQGLEENHLDPRWKSRLGAQAAVVAELAGVGLIDADGSWLDYGCGDGSLSELLARDYGLTLGKYDRYMARDGSYLPSEAARPGAFDFVITTAVFEHLTGRSQMDDIEALVAPGGAFGVCTLVAEHVPSDPKWFYLEPPHCAFFSNAAMDRLFRDWGYRCSIYHVEARLWVWFRSDPAEVAAKVEHLNAQGRGPYHFKEGFLDYWRVDPRARAV